MQQWMRFTLVVLLFWSAWLALPVSGIDTAAVVKLAAEATVEKYPDADSVLLFDDQKAVYQADGTAVETDDYYQKVLTEAGRRDLREITLHFNSTYGNMEIPLLEVIKPDGSVIKVDVAANSRVAVEPGQMGSNIYDPANKILTVTLPELAIGDIVHIVTRDTLRKARIPGVWSGFYLLQSDVPILNYTVTVDAPAARPLGAIALKDPVEGSVVSSEKREGDRIVYTWTARNVPSLTPEPDMPPLYLSAQRLLVSTARDWPEISRWYYQLSRPRLDAVTPELKARTEELIRNAATPEAKVQALFQFVSQQIRYMGVTAETEAPGYEPHDVSMTFQQRYGVCRDKAALLVAMLELAGFKAYPVLFMSGPPKDDEVPNPYFNHAIAAVEVEPGRYQLMDPTFETTTELLPSALSNMSYLVATPTGDRLRRSDVVPAAKNLLKIRTEAAVTPAGVLTGSSHFAFEGINDQIYRDAFSRWPSEFRRQFFAALLKHAIPGAEVEKLEVLPADIRNMKEPLTVELTFRVDRFLPEHSGEFPFQLPEYGNGLGAVGFVLGSVGLRERRFPLEIFSTCGVEEEFRLALPLWCRILSLPPESDIAAPGLLDYRRKVTGGNGMVVGNRYFAINSVEVKPADYLKIKKALREIDTAERRLPIAEIDYQAAKLRAAAFPAADSLLLLDEAQYKLKSDREWSAVHTTERQILNYAGVKRYSELKIAYNPAWEEVSVEAQVTDAAGKVHKLAPGELNLMDAPWSAGAPRYPAGKILVASLPGVAPGATVRTVVTRQVRQRPFFAEILVFQDVEPALLIRSVIDVPDSVALRCSPAPAEVDFTLEEGGGRIIRSWSRRNVQAVPREPGTAPLWMFAPSVFVSTGSYENYSRMLAGEFERLGGDAPRAAETARKIVEKCSTPLEKAVAIRDFVARNIRSAGPGFGALPLSALTPADRTLESGYGDSADRAILLGAMLKAAGLRREFVAVSSLGYCNAFLKELNRYPQRIFDAVLVYLPEEKMYLNDTGEYAAAGAVNSADRLSLPLPGSRLGAIRPEHRYLSSRSVLYSIRLEPDGSARIRAEIDYLGSEFETANRRFSEMLPEKRRQYFEEVAADFSQSARLVGTPKYDFKKYPGRLSFEVEVPDFAAAGDRRLQFALPGSGAFVRLVNTADSSRRTPLWRNGAQRLSIEYRIELPDNFEPVRKYPSRLEFGSYGSANFTRVFHHGDGVLLIDNTLTLPVELVRPLDYRILVELQRQLSGLELQRIVLKQK